MPKQRPTFHEALMAKKGLYAAWHKFPNYQLFNWLIFGLMSSFMALAVVANIRVTSSAIFAQTGSSAAWLKPLAITSNKITDISSTSVTIIFSTNLESSGAVFYGSSSDSLNKSLAVDEKESSHTVKIFNLRPNTRYFYQVTALGIGNSTVSNSAIANFRTLAK